MAESRPLYTLLKLLQEQGILKGDVNVGQRIGLWWIMNRELDDIVLMEKIRMQSMALAGNPATRDDFVKTLFTDPIEKTEEEELQENVEWKQPQSIEELEELERMLTGK